MSLRRHRAQLGDLLDSHRPVNPVVGAAITAVLPAVIAFFPALSFGAVGGLVFFIGFGIPMLYGLAEWLFLQHRIYQHGIVLRSVPGLRTYVVPFYTVDPDDVAIGDRHVRDGGGMPIDRALRVTPMTSRVVWFNGLDPRFAHRLAKGKLQWDTAGDDYEVHRGQEVWVPQAANRWAASYRDPGEHRQILVEAIRSSQRLRPYHRAGWRPPGP